MVNAMGNIELLAPAGGWESLRAAADFGADAVYAAGKSYGLRAFADNFDPGEIAEAADYLHRRGKRLYITLNAVFHAQDFAGLNDYIAALRDAQVDAFIVTDPGVLTACRRIAPDIPLHLSTQANTTNAASALFWHEQGVSRVILSRELSLAEIAEIRQNTPKTLELEAFVHGAMCIAYSGRCLLSSFFTGRSGNGGACAQPCRWEYHLSERGYDGEYFPAFSDDRGTYVLNSKDLCMIGYIREMLDAGIVSFKIEGRMKSAYYVACVTGAYRRAMSDVLAGRPFDATLLAEVGKAGSRPFTTGFYFGNPREAGQDTQRGSAVRTYDFVGVVQGETDADGRVLIQQRGKFCVGDTLEALTPRGSVRFSVVGIRTPEGEERESAPHPKEPLIISGVPEGLAPGHMLRIKRVGQ
jgi:putative protease